MNEIQYHDMQESAALAACHQNLLAALKQHDTGRWDWDRIDCCLTGKDADLEPHGYQGIELVSITDETVTFNVHGGKTIPGCDVTLNTPDGLDDDEDYIDIYLEQAQLVVVGAGSSGYWSGDDWFMDFTDTVTIQWEFNTDLTDGENYEATAQSIIDAANKALEVWEREMVLADSMIMQLAGWRDSNGEQCEEGKPDMDVSVFNPIYRSHMGKEN